MSASVYTGADPLKFVGRLMLATLLTAGVLASCDNDKSITDCAERDRGQVRDSNGEWTCK